MPVSFANNGPAIGRGWVSRLDVRTKIGIGLATSLAVVGLSRPDALGVLAVASAGYVLSLRRFGLFLAVNAALAAMWCIAVGMMAGLHRLWPQAPALELIKLTGPFLRTLIMVDVALVLALSSRIQDILLALKILRLPFFLYVPLAVMVRFVPAFMEDIRMIAESLRIRGHRLSAAGVICRPRLTVRLLLMPLLIRALRSADELGMAAELKGIGTHPHLTPLRRLHFKPIDAMAAMGTLVLIGVGIALQMAGPESGRLLF